MKFYVFILLLVSLFYAEAEAKDKVQSEHKETESPWIFTPTISSSPKLGNSLGALGSYLHKFDEKSPTSMFGAMGSYSDTDSSMYGIFSQLYFLEDQHRFKIGVMKGEIENEYEDFLGTGLPAVTTDNIRVTFINYTKRLKNDWFVGLQMVGVNYEILAGDSDTQDIIDTVGLETLHSRGLGGVIEHDTRDTQSSPQQGSLFMLKNIAFREGFGSNEDYDTYKAKYSHYFGHGNGHVFAVQIDGRWTHNAPTSAFSSVNLRGYTRGEYLAPHSVTMQIEERYSLSEKWGATGFLGAACLYGDDKSCGDSDNWYPAVGAGMTYMLKTDERMIVRAEFAIGTNESRGFYVQFGNAF